MITYSFTVQYIVHTTGWDSTTVAAVSAVRKLSSIQWKYIIPGNSTFIENRIL